MKKTIVFLTGVLLVTLVAEVSHAQLINYKRRENRENKGGAAAAGGGYGAKKTAEPAAAEPAVPSWMQSAPKVTVKEEEKYDVNRDGILQTSEAKILLRDVIDMVDAKGGAVVASPIAKLYDKNRDGVINRYEVADIKTDVQK